MATDAPTTGARRRAPANPADTVPSPNKPDTTANAQSICTAAEVIDAMTLGVEVMIENQRRLMRDQNAGSFLLDNELWSGIATLLTMVRSHAFDIGKTAETIEIAQLPGNRDASA